MTSFLPNGKSAPLRSQGSISCKIYDLESQPILSMVYLASIRVQATLKLGKAWLGLAELIHIPKFDRFHEKVREALVTITTVKVQQNTLVKMAGDQIAEWTNYQV